MATITESTLTSGFDAFVCAELIRLAKAAKAAVWHEQARAARFASGDVAR